MCRRRYYCGGDLDGRSAGEGGGGGGCGRPFGGLDGQLNVARVVRVCPCHSATSLAKDAADRRSLATHLRTAAVDVTRKWLSAISPQTMILLGGHSFRIFFFF